MLVGVVIHRSLLLKRRYYLLFQKVSMQTNERESRRRRVTSMTSYVCLSVSVRKLQTTVLPSRETRLNSFVDSSMSRYITCGSLHESLSPQWFPTSLVQSLNRVSILLLICSKDLGTIQNHSSLQVR